VPPGSSSHLHRHTAAKVRKVNQRTFPLTSHALGRSAWFRANGSQSELLGRLLLCKLAPGRLAVHGSQMVSCQE
jgi:hypothetical protein